MDEVHTQSFVREHMGTRTTAAAKTFPLCTASVVKSFMKHFTDRSCPILAGLARQRAPGAPASSSYGLEITKHSGGRKSNPNTGSESGMSNNCSYASSGHPALTLQATGVGEECSHMHSTESPASLSSPKHQVLANGSGRITDQKSQNSSLLWPDNTYKEETEQMLEFSAASNTSSGPLIHGTHNTRKSMSSSTSIDSSTQVSSRQLV
ncbi:hypothetical protein Anapl_00391 [Anas platyrhynchos]|uniref:Uncharacterized protein n=1 Tax=Anas platyrhynchos TaxID=8839 RepID=R0LKV2_ANAPL|nr:hypothetical protein Anapl_00391 [Anas platyrhynchos]